MDPMKILAPLVGGQWHLLSSAGQPGLTMVHTFTWQVEGALLVSTSASSGGESYGYWYWHPSEKKIKMISLGKVLQGISLAEYTEVTRDGNTMICALTTHGANGIQKYREEWHFTDQDHYAWTLHALTESGEQEAMQASFERRNS